MVKVDTLKEFELELATAVLWYETEVIDSPQLAQDFEAEVKNAIAQIAEMPHAWPRYLKGTRHYLLRRFPYFIVYEVEEDGVLLLALAHAKRRPGYWQKRHLS